MTRLVPALRLPLRIQSLVSLTSILVRLQPISSVHTTSRRPITSQDSCPLDYTGRIAGGRKGLGSQNCPIISGDSSYRPISTQSTSWFMCGNSLSSMACPTPAIVPAKGTHTGTVIFLHGLGDQGYGWAEGFDEIKEPHIKYIFPHAGHMSVTLNMGMKMPSWFDIYSLGIGGKEDELGIKKASEYLNELIAEEEQKGIPSNRIVIGGFSQGGSVALYSALTYQKTLGGVLALSTWMPLFQNFQSDTSPKKTFPLLQCHGEIDPLLNIRIGKLTHDFLQTRVANPEFKKFESLQHSSSLEEMACVKEFLKIALP